MHVLGLTFFSPDNGTPKDEKIFLTTVMLQVGGDVGKSTTNKSSKRGRTKGSLWVLYNIQQADSLEYMGAALASKS